MNETRAGSNAEAHEPEMMHLKNRKKLWLIPAAAAGTGAGSVYWIYRYIFHSPRKNQDDDHDLPIPIPTQEQRGRCISLIDALNAKPYERVSILSHDGLQLSGRYYHTADGAPLAILCHGYRGTPTRDFCGGANICLSRGFNVLMIEERAHCSSEGHTISFGINERYDVLNWTRYAAERFGPDTKILLGGISMGAATVLMASELGLPQNVRGILADCPYTTPEEIITHHAGRNHHLDRKETEVSDGAAVPVRPACGKAFRRLYPGRRKRGVGRAAHEDPRPADPR